MISILLPTYNQAKFLPDALAGLAAQTYRNFKVFVCNDGSTDGTAEWIREHHLRKRPFTITPVQQWPRFLHHRTNFGTAVAINSAAELVSNDSEYITWVSSDNIMYPNWLATLYGYLKAEPELQAVYSDYCRHDLFPNAGKTRPRTVATGAYYPGRLIAGLECYMGPSFLVRREAWIEHREGLAHDYDWWLRFEERTQAIGYIPEPLCEYRMGPWQTGRNRPMELLEDARRRQAEAVDRRQRAIHRQAESALRG